MPWKECSVMDEGAAVCGSPTRRRVDGSSSENKKQKAVLTSGKRFGEGDLPGSLDQLVEAHERVSR
jgi:hypothetical protein